MTEGCLRPTGTLCCALLGKEGRGQEARPVVLGTFWDEWSQWRNRLPPKWGGGCACGNKSEGLAQEVHRRHPPLGGGGQERPVDRQRPRDEPLVGAIVPLAQRHLPPRRRLDAARPEGLLFLRRSARAGRPRRLVRPRDRQRPSLAQTLEEHREGRAAPDTDQDRLAEARGRQGPGGYPLASVSARPGLRPALAGTAFGGLSP